MSKMNCYQAARLKRWYEDTGFDGDGRYRFTMDSPDAIMDMTQDQSDDTMILHGKNHADGHEIYARILYIPYDVISKAKTQVATAIKTWTIKVQGRYDPI